MTRRFLVPVVALLALAPLASCGDDDTATDTTTDDVVTITVRHGEVPAPVLIDGGDEGASVGDVRLFHFDGEASDGEAVVMDWIMTTTAEDAPAPDVESRVTTGVFSFGEGTDDQLLLEGVAYYPGEQATLEVSNTVLRAVVGGTGRFAGARGDVASTRLDDGSWEHVFRLED